MDDKLKFFDSVFKVLVILSLCAWGLFAMLLLFGTDTGGCGLGVEQLLKALAILAAVASTAPLAYGLTRLLFWPDPTSTKAVRFLSWIAITGIALFVAAVFLFAAILTQLGCA